MASTPDIEKHDRDRLLKKQRDMCERTGNPHFAPANGRCYRCRRDIVALQREAYEADQLITGCDFGCHRSFCD
jgi:hypothetical protein